MLKTGISLTAALVIFVMGAGSALGQSVYKWTDENGVVHFSDSRPEGQEVTEQVLTQDQSPAAESPYASELAQPSAAEEKRQEIARKHQEAAERDAAASAHCSSWQAEVDRLEPNRRVFYTDESGETVRMDDVERTDKVAELKRLIAQNCG